ncbi:MAG: hypothetical protein BWZ10_03101 [candidate division BRC1 bacterium ADurb.BinA364]|nr:MAG: hypothetical protein BWZ10_03101 [candidate division BRC1 bacterium ADurb.BinA364]
MRVAGSKQEASTTRSPATAPMPLALVCLAHSRRIAVALESLRNRPEMLGSPEARTTRSPFNTPSGATAPLYSSVVRNRYSPPSTSSANAETNSLRFDAGMNSLSPPSEYSVSPDAKSITHRPHKAWP